MKLLVTGARGGLGRAFLAWLRAGLGSHHDVSAFGHEELDIGDHVAVMAAVIETAPEAIVNLAAFTRVDECESDEGTAFHVNALGPQSLALAAREVGATLLHVSTDYVFDGEKDAPYDELDEPSPISEYGRSKLAGERLVREVLLEHFVVRTGHLFGSGTDHLSRSIERLRRGEAAGGLVDRVGTPTSVAELATRLVPLLLSRRFGTYHLTGPDVASWFQVLSRAKELGGLPGEVESQHAEELGLPAPRPRNAALRSLYSAAIGIEPMPSLDLSLKDLLERR
ncbi:MAG TPA: NAD(P)-dependent oxidoreductase [Actinomycetota bacterium]|jgi:dTDP-4-dehydrorhamnose reductase